MKTDEISEIAALEPHIQAGSSEPLLLTRNGQVVGTVVPGDEQDVENMLLSINPKFQAILERSRDRLAAEGGVSGDDVRRQLGLPPAKSAS